VSDQRTPAAVGHKLAVALVAAVLAGLVAWWVGDRLSLHWLVEQDARLRQEVAERPLQTAVVAAAIYVAVTGLSLPGATFLTLTYGWLFGFWPAVVLVNVSATAGATLAFLLSRYLFRDAVERSWGRPLAAVQTAVARDGAWYLLFLRLVPAFPFFVVNAVMGLTPMSTWTYWWATQLGTLPGTMVYVWAGASVPSATVLAERGARGLLTPQLFAAFLALGLFPLLMKWVVSRLRPAAQSVGEATTGPPPTAS
jgi:uncharacterized membrane protein YdjX (TVP38/TMEM64 family)